MSYVLVAVFCLAIDRPQVECHPEPIKTLSSAKECGELALQMKSAPNGGLVCVPVETKP